MSSCFLTILQGGKHLSYEQKLMAMKKLLTKSVPKKKVEQKSEIAQPPNYEAKWLAAGLTKETNKHGIVYKRVVEYDQTYKHGNTHLSGLKSAMNEWQISGETHPLAPDFTKKLVFFDTETTGLKGAGTLIFLLGFIEQTQKSFKLTQYLLPGPDHEAAFLYASRLWEKELTLVTFNGKSFDVPQLQTRWTMNRNALPPLLSHAHIDLLHASRRIWKEEINRFKLTNLEEDKLEFFREGDIPGHLAPIIYQDAVKSGRIETLMKVLDHNEWDILSLVTLYIKSTELVFPTKNAGTAITQTNIGKWFADLKSYDRSQQFFESVINQYGANHPVTHFHFGFIMKRNLSIGEAVLSFTVAANGLTGRNRIIALEELAKLHEHRLKELDKALEFTRNARNCLLQDSDLTERFRIQQKKDFQWREMRLLRKLFPGQAQDATTCDIKSI